MKMSLSIVLALVSIGLVIYLYILKAENNQYAENIKQINHSANTIINYETYNELPTEVKIHVEKIKDASGETVAVPGPKHLQ